MPPTEPLMPGVHGQGRSSQLGEREGLGRYVLMTAAYNEEENIGKTIESLLAQTRLPEKWMIVSDSSSDATDDIVQSHAKRHCFIHFLRMTRPPGRSFGAKVLALRTASKSLHGSSFGFIGNLDADITLDPTYFEDLLQRFQGDDRLGLAGGFVHEKKDGEFRSRRDNRSYAVPHAAQLVRRQCYEEFGGYAVLEYGGEDWHAETSARMNGWRAEAFPELRILHHRRTGEADNLLRHKFRQGRMDYSFGSDPLFETLKCADRLFERPFLIGGLWRLAGFFWSWSVRAKRPVSQEFMAFLRAEQNRKLQSTIRRYFSGVQPKSIGCGRGS